MLEIRPIQDGDLEYVRENPFQESLKYYPPLKASPISSFTCLFDGDIVAVGGVIDFFPGVGEVWLMLTKQARKEGVFGIIAITAIEKKMNELIVEHKLWRTEANVRTDFPQAIKMIKAFGFEYEGRKRQCTPDRCDMEIYAKIND